MTETATILRQEVRRAGVICFKRFMELALYCPNSGYYERVDAPVGQRGDFFTSVSTGRLFGKLLAFQFASWLEEISVQTIHLVEAGAHDGQLAADILYWLQEHRPGLFDRLEYWLVEPSHRRQEWQRKKLEGFAGRVRWTETLRDLPENGINGVIFSNELLDAFPVHRIAWEAKKRQWFEWGVAVSDDLFVWRRMPDDGSGWDDELVQAGFEIPDQLKSVLPDGFVLELCPSARKWWRKAASLLRRGKLLTIDYGFSADQFLNPERLNGTLRAYHRHRVSTDVLANPGEQDLTAHVNFTALERAGESADLAGEEIISQSQFLTRIAGKMWSGGFAPSATQLRQFQTLTHPEHLGRSFKVLVQSRAGG